MTLRRFQRLLLFLTVLALAGSVTTPAHGEPVRRIRSHESPRTLVEAMALDAVAAEGHLVTSPGVPCPDDELWVSWNPPDTSQFEVGGHIEPVGPPPASVLDDASGIVRCGASTHMYVGFEAWHDQRWRVELVPGFGAEEPAAEPEASVPTDLSAGLSTTSLAPSALIRWPTYGPVEPYPDYVGQHQCSPSEKPGAVRLRAFLLDRYPTTGSLGIVRACNVGGQSEHKEGRAFDWAVNARTSQRALAADFLARLMISDSNGELHAMARRVGAMYIIWNRTMWRSYRPDDGWTTYNGPHPHDDHVHFSLSEWAANYGDGRHANSKSFYRAYEDYKNQLSNMWPQQDATLALLPDVGRFSRFLPEISWLVATGLSTGYSDGTWRPGTPVSRGAIAAILWRQAGSPGGFPAADFTDRDRTPFRLAIDWLAGQGITTGYDDGSYRPTAPVSRGAMVTFLWRMSGSPAGPSTCGFRDIGPGSPFARAICWATSQGIVNGYDDGTFRAGTATSRQAMAAFLHRWSNG